MPTKIYRVRLGNGAICDLSIDDSYLAGVEILDSNKVTTLVEFTRAALRDRIGQADCMSDGMEDREQRPQRLALIRAWRTMKKALAAEPFEIREDDERFCEMCSQLLHATERTVCEPCAPRLAENAERMIAEERHRDALDHHFYTGG